MSNFTRDAITQICLAGRFFAKYLKLIMFCIIIAIGLYNFRQFNELKFDFMAISSIYIVINIILYALVSDKKKIISDLNFQSVFSTFGFLYGITVASQQYKSELNVFLNILILLMVAEYIFYTLEKSFNNYTRDEDHRKKVLVHEIGHYFMTKELKNCVPDTISLRPNETSYGRIHIVGDIESNSPSAVARMLIAGEVTVKYLFDKNNGYLEIDNDLNGILLNELKTEGFSPEYVKAIKNISYDKDLLITLKNEIVKEVETNKDLILKMADKFHLNDLIKITSLEALN